MVVLKNQIKLFNPCQLYLERYFIVPHNIVARGDVSGIFIPFL